MLWEESWLGAMRVVYVCVLAPSSLHTTPTDSVMTLKANLRRFRAFHPACTRFPALPAPPLRVCAEHEGWSDYVLTTAVSVVYTSGFIMMVPQLYIVCSRSSHTMLLHPTSVTCAELQTQERGTHAMECAVLQILLHIHR